MSKRNLFEELSTALVEAKQHSEDKLTLRTHVVQRVGVPEIKPQEILTIREMFNMSRGVFARHLHTSARTLGTRTHCPEWSGGNAITFSATAS